MWGWVIWIKGIKRYKPPVMTSVIHRDVKYSIRNVISNVVITLNGKRW